MASRVTILMNQIFCFKLLNTYVFSVKQENNDHVKKKGTIYINLVQKSYFKLAKCVIVPIIELIQKN